MKQNDLFDQPKRSLGPLLSAAVADIEGKRRKQGMQSAVRMAAIEVKAKWNGHRFKDQDIPDHVWEKEYLDKINPPRKYWESNAEREEFLQWCEAKQAEHRANHRQTGEWSNESK